MTNEEMKDLKPGDVIGHLGSSECHGYIVTANYGDRVTAVRTIDVTNPVEWEVRVKARVAPINAV